VRIRPGTVQDADAVAQTVLAVLRTSMEDVVDAQTAFERKPEDEAADWRARLADPAGNIVLVACHGERPVGVAAWRASRPSAGEPVRDGTLTHLAVHPAAQGAGVGDALLRRAEDELRAVGGRSARTSLHREAWWATRFFDARGWARSASPPADPGPYETWERSL
jgi:GNAT superfamily N-acetyltransferase